MGGVRFGSMSAASRHRPLRICLVVDNPLRDLEGIVLVAWHLARQGATVYLVPMYDQGTAVLGVEPDVVVVNYARTTNRELLRVYHEAGILVSVLDTEGGIVDSLEEYATSVKRNGTAPYIDQMLMWGPVQYDAFATHSGLPKERLVLTGCPRMDLCSRPWRDTLPRPTGVSERFVLVNTNFSLVNPMFSASLERELSTTLDAGFSGWNSAYIERLASETRDGMERMIAAIRELATALPDLSLVIRPHPFENVDTYRQALAGLSNVQVRLEGAVMAWINASQAMLHLNCGSAVEAALLGKPAINLDWLNTDALVHNAPFPREISHLTNSMSELKAMLEGVQRGRELTVPVDRRAASLTAVRQWFHNGDGQAAKRVADAVLGLAASHSARDRTALRRLAFIGAQKSRPLYGVVDVTGKLFFGSIYRWFRNAIASGSVARGTRNAKAFTVRQVNDIMGRLQLDQEFTASARPVEWRETWIPGQGRTSVAVASVGRGVPAGV